MADIQETRTGDFAVTGRDSELHWQSTVMVPREVMLAWMESWAEEKIKLYLRGGE